nr:PREDICTED: rho GTPase-activating protein gacZ-like isoform X2 [Bemisia tabaci]
MASITNKRKTGCGSNSDGSSNASSPSVTASLNNAAGAPFYPHLTANAPKNGVVIPNRVFVGGIASTTTEAELTAFFSKYGQVKDVKIIVDRGGISKGYGFVTFDSEEEANKLQQAADDVNFQGRRLNIAAAIKKQVCILQPYNRSFDASSTSPTMPPNVYYHNGIQYTYQNGMAFFSPGNPPTNAIAPVQAHPESVRTFGPPHGSTAAPSFGPAMMYHPCPPNPPPPVYLPTQQYAYQPLPFDSYYQVASQSSGIMYSAGAGPTNINNTTSAQNSSLVTVGDSGSSQTVQLISAPTGSIYAAPHILHDVHYSAQSIYPVNAVESLPPYNEIQTIESPPSNISAEGSLCSKAEHENTTSTTSSETKPNDLFQTPTPVTSTVTPVVSWLQCSERYECTKTVNDKQINMSENSTEQATTATVYPVMFNPFSRPPTARHPFSSTINGYSDNYPRIRNFVPYVYNVEARRPSNPNVPKQQNINHNNNYIANSSYTVKTADVSNQTRNSPRLPRYPKVRPLVSTPNFRFLPPYCPRFGYYPPHFLPLPPPQIAASRRFSGPSCRRQNVYIPVSSSNNNSTGSYDDSSTTCTKNSNTVNHNNNNTNFTNNNNSNTGNSSNVGSNGAVKIAKSVTSKAEPESGALCGAGDAPSSSHPTNITAAGPTPLELSHQMQKLST